MIKRHNHFVPDSYLRRWTNDQGQVSTYRVLVPHQNERDWKHHFPKSIGYHEHFYTRIAAGGETDAIETWFEQAFETPAAPVLQRAVTDQQLSRGDWRLLVRFLAAQDLRTPAKMRERFKHWNEIMPSLLDETLTGAVRDLEEAARTGRSLPVAPQPEGNDMFPARTFVEIAPHANEGQLHVETTIGRSLWLWSLKRALTITLDVLHEHRWTILRSPPGIEWLTSDDPVMRLNYQDPQHYDFGGGWGSQGTEIIFPLSPDHLMYTQIGNKSPPRRGTPASLDLATKIQKLTVEHAHRYVFARTANPDVKIWRPRIVDNRAFHAERDQWKAWNKEQSEAERALLK